jgi:hypothetical protein
MMLTDEKTQEAKGSLTSARRRHRLHLALGLAGVVLVAGVLTSVTAAAAAKAPSIVATYVPASLTPSAPNLTRDARVMTIRLKDLGYSWASAEVRGQSIDVVASKSLPQDHLAVVGSQFVLQLRPVLCFGGAYSSSKFTSSRVPSGCSLPRYATTADNLDVNQNTGHPQNIVANDPALARVRSSTPEFNDANPTRDVLVPGAPGANPRATRYLLGPVGVGNDEKMSARAVASGNRWLIEVGFSKTASSRWDALAKSQFHTYVGVDLDGAVLSVHLIEPTQSTFTSLEGRVQVSGSFTRQSAQALALLLNSGRLSGSVRLTAVYRVPPAR